ncbi:DUF2441 domain-containing protein [Paenibacillus athensensis]|uniref:Uncharacterized protein n=1 Tax=Paenibacillus athensensis TaxID=1967502 RepID=A0A4Y8QA95_9BACL|nr:DUF2441 domain-containing protein [Paenibacillus athensensis]MCD1257664.1 DUF2441 domain-containing protein [Paenibacillus athensensis]
MQYVNEAEYYHIQRNKRWGDRDNWNVGDVIEIGKIQNKFMESRYSTDYKIDPELNFESVILKLQGKPLDKMDRRFLQDISNVWREYITKTREYIFEYERVRINNKLPSRFRCLFVTDKEGIKYWLPLLGNADEASIYKLALTGIIHKTNEKFVRLNTNSQEFNHEQARKYWAGEDAEQQGYEYLFEGKVKVLDVVNKVYQV